MKPGEPQALCLDCRTLLASLACEDEHEVVSLHEADGRARLLAAVWGAPSQPTVRYVTVLQPWLRRFGWAFRLTALGFGATLVACLPFTLCDDHPLEALVAMETWLFIALILAIVIPALVVEGWSSHAAERGATRVVERAGRDAPSTGPHGVSAHPARDDGFSGTVSGAVLQAPISGRSCNAWALWLEHRGEILLRASEGAALHLQLDDGRGVTVPAGRRQWDERGPRTAVRPADVHAWLTRLGVPAASGHDDPFPATRAWEATLALGDRVELYAEVELHAASPVGGASYREAPAHEPLARGVPRLRPR